MPLSTYSLMPPLFASNSRRYSIFLVRLEWSLDIKSEERKNPEPAGMQKPGHLLMQSGKDHHTSNLYDTCVSPASSSLFITYINFIENGHASTSVQIIQWHFERREGLESLRVAVGIWGNKVHRCEIRDKVRRSKMWIKISRCKMWDKIPT